MNLRLPINVAIEVTEDCNYRCPHCYRLNHSKNIKSKNKIGNIEQGVQILLDKRVMSYTLTGGEPFIEKELCLSLVERIKKYNCRCSINTNLSLLDDGIIKSVIENKVDGMLVACPSVDKIMYSNLTGGGDVAIFIDKLKILLSNNISFFINIVFSTQPLEDILNTMDRLHDLGVKNIGATPMAVCDMGNNLSLFQQWNSIKPYLQSIISKAKKLGINYDLFEALPFCSFEKSWLDDRLPFTTRSCQAGKTTCALSPAGEVRPCTRSSESYGNIFKIHLENIWNNMSLWRSAGHIPLKCKDCRALQRCFGACRVNAKVYYGGYDCPDPWSQNPITIPIVSQSKEDIILSPKMIIMLNGSFLEREERKGIFLVSTSKSKFFLLINQEFYLFVKSLIQKLPTKMESIFSIYNIDLNDEHFNRVIRLLLNNRILCIKNP
jgi:radical SAM protein with 4Fe4S-binding SPASM domain